jgi:hypothetical protein
MRWCGAVRAQCVRRSYIAVFIRCSTASVLEQPLIIRFHEVARQLWSSEAGRRVFFGDEAAAVHEDPARRERFEAFIAKLEEADNEALVALCESRGCARAPGDPAARFVVVNTHLYWNPAYADLKALQFSLLCYALRVHLQRWGLHHAAAGGANGGGGADTRCPVVVCADMNSQPRASVVHGGAEGAYLLATTGELGPEHPDHPATDTPAVKGVEGSLPRSSSGPEMVALSTAGIALRSVYGTDAKDRQAPSAAVAEPLATTKTATFKGASRALHRVPAGVAFVRRVRAHRPPPHQTPTTHAPSPHHTTTPCHALPCRADRAVNVILYFTC